MDTITLNVRKTAICIALVVGLVVGGIIGAAIGAHHGRYANREHFSRGGFSQMRFQGPMMNPGNAVTPDVPANVIPATNPIQK